MMKTFAFDVGNGFVKAKNEEKTIVAPSLIARESTLGESSIGDQLKATEEDYHVYHSQIDDESTYVWGTDIKDVVEPRKLLSTYTHTNRYDHKRFKLLVEFILAELASSFEEQDLDDVIVVTGLPSSEIKTEADKNYASPCRVSILLHEMAKRKSLMSQMYVFWSSRWEHFFIYI